MKVSLKWLSEYVEVPSDTKAFCDRLDLTGTGVEGVERTGDTFDKVVTGQVIEKAPHPDSDHMWVLVNAMWMRRAILNLCRLCAALRTSIKMIISW